MANFFQCCKKHSINLDLVCYTDEQSGSLYVSFTNGKSLYLKGKCKELVEQSIALMVYYNRNN
jgi:hypothetical protein